MERRLMARPARSGVSHRFFSLGALLTLIGLGCGAGPELAPTAPGLLQGGQTPVFGGVGDQLWPSLHGGVLAYVDYASDSTGGCENTLEDQRCDGVLRVVQLSRGHPPKALFAVPVNEAWPAVGEGFVVWVERQRAEPQVGWASVRLLDLSTGELRTLLPAEEGLQLHQAPQVQGQTVAVARSRPYSSVELLFDPLQADRTRAPASRRLELRNSIAAQFSFWQQQVAYAAWDPNSGQIVSALRRLDAGSPQFLPQDSERILRGTPLLGEGHLVERSSARSCAKAPCPVRLTLLRQSTGERRNLNRDAFSTLGPLLIAGGRVFWLEYPAGPYELWSAPLSAGAGGPVRVSPSEAQLTISMPQASDGNFLAWCSATPDGDFDLQLGLLAN